MAPIDVGHRWAADSPRWFFWRGEEVWLRVAAADGRSHGWVCVPDRDRPLRPAQSLPTGWLGCNWDRDWNKSVCHCSRFLLPLVDAAESLCQAFRKRLPLYTKCCCLILTVRFTVSLTLKGTWWAAFRIWSKKVECSPCGGATGWMSWKLPQKLPSSSQLMNR